MSDDNETDYSDVFDATESVAAKAKEVDDSRDKGGNFVKYLSLNEGEECLIRFLHDEPLTFYQHREYDPDARNGQGGYSMLTCVKGVSTCPLCENGSKRSYRGAYLVLHLDHEEDGKVVPTPKLFVRGINDLRVIDAKRRKFDLVDYDMEVSRVGKATDTRYLFDRVDSKSNLPQFDRSMIDNAKNEDEYIGFLKKQFRPRPEKMKAIASKAGGGSSSASSGAEKPTPVDDDEDIPF